MGDSGDCAIIFKFENNYEDQGSQLTDRRQGRIASGNGGAVDDGATEAVSVLALYWLPCGGWMVVVQKMAS